MLNRSALALAALLSGPLPVIAEPSPLAGVWRIKAITGASAVAHADAHLTVKDDGSLSTTVGCNRMAGKSTIGDGTIAIGPMISTKMACAEALMAQEQAYAKALEAVRGFEREDRALKLLDATGATLVTLERASD